MNEQTTKYVIPDVEVKVRNRRFWVSGTIFNRTAVTHTIYNRVILDEMMELTLGAKRDAKILAAQYLNTTVSCIYKQICIYERWLKEGKVREIEN